MKKLLIPLFSLTLIVGCMSPSQQRTTFNTLGSAEATATAAVDGYYLAAAKGLADTNGIPVVTRSYNQFQGVMQTAVILSKNNTNALATANIMSELSTVIGTVASFSPTKVNVTPK